MAIDKVFAKGRMHELVGKSVEVKRATPKGTGSAVGRSQGWRGFERHDQRGPLEPAAVRSQAQGWTAYGSPPGMIYAGPGYQVQPGPVMPSDMVVTHCFYPSVVVDYLYVSTHNVVILFACVLTACHHICL